MDSRQLDLIFRALSDSTRRAILSDLSGGARTVGELCTPFDMSQPAISKHLRVLETAGLIQREKRGRESLVSARAELAEEAAAWIQHYSRFWRQHFDQVEQHLTLNRRSTDDDGNPD